MVSAPTRSYECVIPLTSQLSNGLIIMLRVPIDAGCGYCCAVYEQEHWHFFSEYSTVKISSITCVSGQLKIKYDACGSGGDACIIQTDNFPT